MTVAAAACEIGADAVTTTGAMDGSNASILAARLPFVVLGTKATEAMWRGWDRGIAKFADSCCCIVAFLSLLPLCADDDFMQRSEIASASVRLMTSALPLPRMAGTRQTKQHAAVS